MKKSSIKTVVVVLMLFALLTIPSVKAEDLTVTPETIRQDAKTKMMDIREQKAQAQQAIKDNVKAMKEEAMQKREDFKMMVDQKREEAMQKAQASREEFKVKMEQIKVNAERTGRLSQHIDSMTSILERIRTKSAERKTAGADTSAVDSALSEASIALELAKTAVSTQASKEYVLTVTDETKLKESTQAIFATFKSDMEATIATVKSAKEALVVASKALATTRPTTETQP